MSWPTAHFGLVRLIVIGFDAALEPSNLIRFFLDTPYYTKHSPLVFHCPKPLGRSAILTKKSRLQTIGLPG
jgi:hypothetical protein